MPEQLSGPPWGDAAEEELLDYMTERARLTGKLPTTTELARHYRLHRMTLWRIRERLIERGELDEAKMIRRSAVNQKQIITGKIDPITMKGMSNG